ncbi:MAG: DciA family protein [Hydrogenophaga sp.]|uniref:DciA family protein n=1 Tax=Hydrogenophaga sp. TaxID=1904254 RepID=UPI0026363632|nr:DciA family protein [Hydrogenophaga sp.]MDM7941124.1 DciA family protein [Hydrogenophaga sp.]
MATDQRPRTLFSLEQAVGAAPSLALLRERIRESQNFLDQVRHLIPPAMRQQVVAGPLQEQEWCLLVGSAAASTKLRQMLPAIQRVLTQNGAQVNAIRIKVQTPAR